MSGSARLSALLFAVLGTPRCKATTQGFLALRRPCLRLRRGPPPPCAATLTTGPRISTPADDDSIRDGGREGGGRVGRSERQQRQQLLSGKVRRPGTPWLRRSASSCLCAVSLTYYYEHATLCFWHAWPCPADTACMLWCSL